MRPQPPLLALGAPGAADLQGAAIERATSTVRAHMLRGTLFANQIAHDAVLVYIDHIRAEWKPTVQPFDALELEIVAERLDDVLSLDAATGASGSPLTLDAEERRTTRELRDRARLLARELTR